MNIGLQPIDPSQTIAYLRTLPAIRERCSRVHDLATKGQLDYFDYHPENESQVVDFCAGIIQRDFGSDYDKIPPHGRWRHLDAGHERIAPLLTSWTSQSNPPDKMEQTRRLIDLFVVSVLLDAGAGSVWKYTEPDSQAATFSRSEGLGVASFHMFKESMFSSNPDNPHQVDGDGLLNLTLEKVASGLQVSEANTMTGLEGRAALLTRLGNALKTNKQYFGEDGRPGNLVDYLATVASTTDGDVLVVPVAALWAVLIEGLDSIWPASRTQLNGVSLGDVWPCSVLKGSTDLDGHDLVPFHKLTGWMTYSLMEPVEKILGWKFHGVEDMTGLPEYRNGGLLLDMGVLALKPNKLTTDPLSGLPQADPSHPAIVEWRAMTIIELDRIAQQLRAKLNFNFTLAQILESATWKGGREIAKQKRPTTSSSPIEILSDGTVF